MTDEWIKIGNYALLLGSLYVATYFGFILMTRAAGLPWRKRDKQPNRQAQQGNRCPHCGFSPDEDPADWLNWSPE